MTSEQAPVVATGDGLYPPLEYLHRISHGNVTAHIDPLSTEPRTPQPSVRQPSVPAISQHSLPTYRQANVSRETVTSSSHPLSEPAPMESALPDILNSHMLPQTRQHRQHRNHRGRTLEGAPHPHHHSRPHRQQRRSRTRSTSTTQTQEGTCKEPCVKCIATVTSFRWVLIVLSVLGVCCVVTGIVLAAVRSAGNSFLFLAIMFIGLGVLLVIVVGVGWKCTPRGHEPLHALFGIGHFQGGQTRERRPRRHRNRDGQWFGGFMYPEFQYRRPPPTYAASMQDYQNQTEVVPPPETGGSLPASPPPSYRSRASTVHSAIHISLSHDSELPSSRPPTYRSRAPSRRPSIPLREGNSDHTDDSPWVVTDPGNTLEPSEGAMARPVDAAELVGNTAQLKLSDQQHIDKTACVLQSSSSSPTQTLSQTGRNKPHSLHQRMASEDRHILEETLQSLEEHINETEGIANEGASFDEQDQHVSDFNTHL
ncbi:uncharacterized protein LOC131954533 [Physella acuta]|uniref:uncharacterized protein LOC131954533 n=1 Tax=Physella acuta TaxID=109671 RepID=UPI0027DD6489|nr:uncharacterized protein LOC131954533 [Physella acuta]XP_059174381.1 uncharacterized protein LOC131954533 [Physella acuta]